MSFDSSSAGHAYIPVAIIGAGLSGLLAAYRLRQAGVDVQLFEARSRLGGRIATVAHAGVVGEYGGTWFGPHHRRLLALLDELELAVIPQWRDGTVLQRVHPALPVQHLPGPAFEAGTLRLADGSSALVEALQARLPADWVHLDWSIQKIQAQPDRSWLLQDAEGLSVQARQVILAAPPKNLLAQMTLVPALEQDWLQQAQATATWMGHVGKCLCWFDQPFWRHNGCSGSGFIVLVQRKLENIQAGEVNKMAC
jgi:monoamine oxidase